MGAEPTQRSQEPDRADERGDPRENRPGVKDPRAGRPVGPKLTGRRAQDAEVGKEGRGDELHSVIEQGYRYAESE
jgi:hypothetical protein